MQQFDALAVLQGHAQGQEEEPVVLPFTVTIELAGSLVGQITGIEQLQQAYRGYGLDLRKLFDPARREGPPPGAD